MIIEVDCRHDSSNRNSQVGKGGLPPLKIRSDSSWSYQFNVERLRILSGGKPPFPTCEFLSLEWYL